MAVTGLKTYDQQVCRSVLTNLVDHPFHTISECCINFYASFVMVFTDAPPAYDSVFGKVQKVKNESDGNVDFGCKMFGIICCNTGGCIGIFSKAIKILF